MFDRQLATLAAALAAVVTFAVGPTTFSQGREQH